jgi:hypothetical protein
MIESRKILYSNGNNDECYTPRYVVEAIMPFIPKGKTIWCPFDTEQSEFVKVMNWGGGYNVIYSHISYGQDFFEYEPKEWDIMLSNPPFTGKRRIFERALSFRKPFGLLMTMTWMNDAAPKDLFMDKDLQLLLFRNRVKYLKADGSLIDNKITFASGFYCWNLLPKQIIICDK